MAAVAFFSSTLSCEPVNPLHQPAAEFCSAFSHGEVEICHQRRQGAVTFNDNLPKVFPGDLLA
jgi:hypothetical protein